MFPTSAYDYDLKLLLLEDNNKRSSLLIDKIYYKANTDIIHSS